MSERVGVYLCRGCGIGACLDVARLAAAARQSRAAVVRESDAFCLEDARHIAGDLAQGAVDGAVIAACSPRVKDEVFAPAGAVVARVNLREQVAWCQPPAGGETQALALDQLRMGIVQAQKAVPPVATAVPVEPRLLVVGGGSAGLAAARAAAAAGCEVVLVEKSERLGGFAARLHRHFPDAAPWRELRPSPVAAWVEELRQQSNVRVCLGAEVAALAGEPGRFRARIRGAAGEEEVEVGAVVVATGWTPEASVPAGRCGLGTSPDIVTSVAFEAMAAAPELRRPSDGRRVERAAIIVCDGGDGTDGGTVASLVALKQALYLRAHAPQGLVYLAYANLQAPGQFEYFYQRVQEDPGVLFAQGEVRAVTPGERGDIAVEIAATPLGGAVRVAVDLVVLAAGMPPAVSAGGGINLQYLQGPDLPRSAAGFADSNFLCFPYETRRTGIYTAGAARQSMDIAAAARDGAAAALKSLQCMRQSAAGAAVHPRVGDLSHPGFFMQKCTGCGRCSQECPFGALEIDARKHPVLDVNRCRRCGICMGACPVQIISFRDYSVDMLAAMIRSVDMPEDAGAAPRILVFACENDAYPALDMAGLARRRYAPVRVIPVRCLGSVNSVLIADAVARGFDGVALLGCKSGDNYQCHFIRGSELLAARMQNVRETLDRLALEAERVRVLELSIADAHRIPALLEDFTATIARIGPNPMKGL